MSIKTLCRGLDRWLLFIEEWSLVTAVGLALVTAMANVILRKATDNYSLYWSDEVVRKVIYFSTYIGAIAAIRSRSLIRIDALPQMLPILKKPLNIFAHCAVLIFAVIIVVLGSQMTMLMYADKNAVTATLTIPEWPFYLVLPIMGVMMFVRTLLVMWDDWLEAHDLSGDE